MTLIENRKIAEKDYFLPNWRMNDWLVLVYRQTSSTSAFHFVWGWVGSLFVAFSNCSAIYSYLWVCWSRKAQADIKNLIMKPPAMCRCLESIVLEMGIGARTISILMESTHLDWPLVSPLNIWRLIVDMKSNTNVIHGCRSMGSYAVIIQWNT